MNILTQIQQVRDARMQLDGVIMIEGSVSDDVIAQVKEQWKEIYRGYESWAEGIFVSDWSVNYAHIGWLAGRVYSALTLMRDAITAGFDS